MASRRMGDLNCSGDNGMVGELSLGNLPVCAIRPALEADYQPSDLDTRADYHSPQREIDF